MKRVLFAAMPEDVPPVDQYDLMLVDYSVTAATSLDREMSDAELGFRSGSRLHQQVSSGDRAF